jgi:hypothetical protein
MAISQRWTVIGIFNNQDTAKKAMQELFQAEFTPEQVGCVMRGTGQVASEAAVIEGEEAGPFTGGILSGLMGATETPLMPILGTVGPLAEYMLAEYMLERFYHTGIDGQQDHTLPVTDDGISATSTATNAEEDNISESQAIAQTDEDETLKMSVIAQTSQTDEDETLKMSAIAQTSQASESLEPTPQGEDEIVETDKLQNDAETPVDTGDPSGTGDAANTGDTENTTDISRKLEEEATGVITGGIVGGVVGVAAGLLLPFIGPVIAGSAAIAALGGAALGAVAGGFLGTYVGMDVPEEHARHYEQEFKTGRTIVTVKTEDRQQDALNILKRNEAIYVNAHDRAW